MFDPICEGHIEGGGGVQTFHPPLPNFLGKNEERVKNKINI